MHRKLKTVMIAIALTAGLALSASSAQAQVAGWNLIRPTSCFLFANSANGQVTNTLWVYTNTFTVTLMDPGSINAATQWCYDRSAFWAYNTGGSVWSWLYIVPGLK
jgi:hypothetical protein